MLRSLLPLFLASAVLLPAAVMDRIAATVGKQVIAESEVITALRVAAFLDQKPVDLSPEVKRKTAERLVDQKLILQEAAQSHIELPQRESVANLLAEVKKQYGAADQVAAALKQYQITEKEVEQALVASYQALTFTDLRFRPEILVTEDELVAFYQLLAAGWRRTEGAKVPSFEESRAEVEKLFIAQRTEQALDTWLSSTRTQVGVSYRDKAFE